METPKAVPPPSGWRFERWLDAVLVHAVKTADNMKLANQEKPHDAA